MKRAGYELAEQFIMKYPESFKIRYSDKMSGDRLTYIEEVCRERKVTKARQIYEDIVTDNCEHLVDKKRDLDALVDLFGFYNVSEDMVDWPVVHVSKICVFVSSYVCLSVRMCVFRFVSVICVCI